MTAAPGPEVRRAALLLHAMCETDRIWVLQALPEEERAALTVLLVELRELGIPAQQSVMDDMRALKRQGPHAGGGDPVEALQATRLTSLAPWQVQALGRMLRSEPPLLVAHLCHGRAWPWESNVLAQLGAAQRRQVQVALQALSAAGPSAPAADLHDALVRAVDRRLASAASPPHPGSAATPGPRGLRLRLRRWRAMLARRNVQLEEQP